MLRHLTTAALLAGLLCVLLPAGTALAQQEPDWYRVEVIVFRQWAPSAGGGEKPVADAPLPRYRQLTVVHRSGPRAFRRLPADAMQLQGAADRLQSSPDYEVLAHFGWQQPALAENEAVSIALPLNWQPGALSFNATTHRLGVPVVAAEHGPAPRTGSNAQPADEQKTDTDSEADQAEPGTPAVDNNVFASVPIRARLYGTLTVFRGRYLHVDADLRLRPEDQSEGPDTSNPVAPERVYVMRQRRRMRSDELHYLDHPELGLLVKITAAPTAKQTEEGEGSKPGDDGAQ